MQITNHAQKRLQQRGFNAADADLLQTYGNHRISYGCDVYYLSKAIIRREFAGKKVPQRIEKLCGTKCVVAESGELVTICHINKRLRFN